MNHHSSTIKKYFPALVGAALIAASLFQFSRPVFSAGTKAGTPIRNTATGTYEDNDGNDYTIDSNTVEVTVAKVAGITNMPTGFTDGTVTATNNSVLNGDTVSFEFTITNVGNDVSDIHIPHILEVATKGLKRDASLKLEIIGINASDVYLASDTTPRVKSNASQATSTPATVKNVPINGQIIVRVTGTVSATATGAPIEVRLGDTGSNTDPNFPVADTQNQFDDGGSIAGYPDDVKKAGNEVRTLNATTPTSGITALTDVQQKEASAVKQVVLGSNPMAMVKIEKTREINDTSVANTNTPLNDNIITYKLGLEVLNNTPTAQYTPGQLKGRNFTNRMETSVDITNVTNLVLVSDAIPAGTRLASTPQSFTDTDNRKWTPVYSIVSPEPSAANQNPAAGAIEWKASATNLANVTRVGWVYDANSAEGAIAPGTTITGFTFNVVTTDLDATTGGTVANLGQVFGATVGGSNVFDESGDQDPSNFSGANPGPSETATGSTGIADPANHGVDTDNNNNASGSDGGEDNIITISTPGTLFNGPNGEPKAAGNIFDGGSDGAPDADHDFQNKGISNFDADSVSCSTALTPIASGSGNPQSGRDCKLDPDAIVFTNTLQNDGQSSLNNVVLQPVAPSFGGLGGTDEYLPPNTEVRIKYGTQEAIYKYTVTGSGATTAYSFELVTTPNNTHIKIPTLASSASAADLSYTVTIDLPINTPLSTDVGRGYAVPIIAFADADGDNNFDAGEKKNYTVNQVYTDFIKLEKQVKVLKPDGTVRTGMDFADPNTAKKPIPGDILVYRVNYRNISEPQAGNGSNLVLEGKSVKIDENGTQANIAAMSGKGNNWALDNDGIADGETDIDTINVQGTATDNSSGSTITYYTGTSLSTTPINNSYSVDSLTSAGQTDPGETVTGYRVTIPILAPSASKSTFEFQRKVDEYDGLVEEGLD